MKRYLLGLALLCLAATGAQSFWQSRQQTAIASAASPVVLTYQTTSLGSGTGNTETLGSFTIGASATAARRVALAIWSQNLISGVTISGVVFTPNVGSPVNADITSVAGINSITANVGYYLVSAVLPTGTTATVVTTFNSGSGQPPRFSVYTLDNSTLVGLTPTTNYQNSAASPFTEGVTSTSGGAVIALFNGLGTTTETWTAGVTSDGVFGNSDWGHANNVSGGTFNVTNTWTVTGGGNNADIAMWGLR